MYNCAKFQHDCTIFDFFRLPHSFYSKLQQTNTKTDKNEMPFDTPLYAHCVSLRWQELFYRWHTNLDAIFFFSVSIPTIASFEYFVDDLTNRPGKRLHLKCSTNSKPTPKIKFYKDGKSLSISCQINRWLFILILLTTLCIVGLA